MVYSKRVGPGTVANVNDGEWLVIDRLLNADCNDDSGWLLLRQLRDISGGDPGIIIGVFLPDRRAERRDVRRSRI
jgi:hypothetical protein